MFKVSVYDDLNNSYAEIGRVTLVDAIWALSASLNGVSTIRAYGETTQFCAENAARMSAEKRCV